MKQYEAFECCYFECCYAFDSVAALGTACGGKLVHAGTSKPLETSHGHRDKAPARRDAVTAAARSGEGRRDGRGKERMVMGLLSLVAAAAPRSWR